MVSKKNKVLAVDDDHVVRTYLATIIPHLFPGTEVETCSDGVAAVKFLGGGQCIDLILSDIMMPAMDGATFVRYLANNEDTVGIPVILLTSLQDQRLPDLIALPNVIGHIQKPVNPKQLRERLLPLWSAERGVCAEALVAERG